MQSSFTKEILYSETIKFSAKVSIENSEIVFLFEKIANNSENLIPEIFRGSFSIDCLKEKHAIFLSFNSLEDSLSFFIDCLNENCLSIKDIKNESITLEWTFKYPFKKTSFDLLIKKKAESTAEKVNYLSKKLSGVITDSQITSKENENLKSEIQQLKRQFQTFIEQNSSLENISELKAKNSSLEDQISELKAKSNIMERQLNAFKEIIFSKAKLKLVKLIQLHQGEIRNFKILQDGRIATGSKDNTIKILDPLNNFKLDINIQNVHSQGEGCSYINELPNGYIISVSYKTEFKIFKINKFQYELIYSNSNAHNDWINKVINLTRKRMATCSDDKTIKIWNCDINNYSFISCLTGHEADVLCIYQLKNETLVSGTWTDKTLRFWDIEKRICLKIINNIYPGTWDAIKEINNNKIIVGCRGCIYLIDTLTYQIINSINTFNFWAYSFACLNDNNIIYCGSGRGGIFEFNLSDNFITPNEMVTDTSNNKGFCLEIDNFLNIVKSSDNGCLYVYKPIFA